MADQFISALTGDQMDEALLDMARHTSEAWSQGTRAGSPVGTGDETYQNNSKYWASIAQGAIPEGTAGALFYDRPQTLSESQQNQAQENIGLSQARYLSNRNMLDNPWFTIHQRKTTSGYSNAYCADRWITTYGNGNMTWERVANGIKVIPLNPVSHADIYQKIENDVFSNLLGKTVTVSVLIDGVILSKSFILESGTHSYNMGNAPQGNVINLRTLSGGLGQQIEIWCYNTATVITAVKLELGSVSTLAYDIPPNETEELAKCQRYFQKIAINKSSFSMSDFGNLYRDFVVPLATTMYTGRTPQLVNGNNLEVFNSSGKVILTGVSIAFLSPTSVSIRCSGNNFVTDRYYVGISAGNMFIDCEL